MSGGRFDYMQWQIWEAARQVEGIDEPDIQQHKELTMLLCNAAAEAVQRIDWLVSGDDGLDTFFRRWEEKVVPLLKQLKGKI
jgi:hypothetical protein